MVEARRLVRELAIEELVRTTSPAQMQYLEAFVQVKDEMEQSKLRVLAHGLDSKDVTLIIGKGPDAWFNSYAVKNAPDYDTAFRLAIDGMKNRG